MLGFPGHRPANLREPKPVGVPKCPRQSLSPMARKEWKRVAKQLGSVLNRELLEVNCQRFTDLIQVVQLATGQRSTSRRAVQPSWV